MIEEISLPEISLSLRSRQGINKMRSSLLDTLRQEREKLQKQRAKLAPAYATSP